MKHVSKKVSVEIGKKTLLPFLLFIGFCAVHWVYYVKIIPVIPDELHQELKKHIFTLFIICLSFIFQRVIGAVIAWYKENIAVNTINRLDDELLPLVRRTAKIILWIIEF